MALLAKEALQNADFAEICASYKKQVAYGNPPYNRWLTNHHRMLKSYEGCIGIKTGFTKKSGRCLVSAAERGGITLICVTLKASDDYNVHKALFDYGFSTAKQLDLSGLFAGVSCPVVGGEQSEVRLRPADGCVVSVLQGEEREITFQTKTAPFYYAPVNPQLPMGELSVYIGQTKLGSFDLYPEKEIAQKAPKKKGIVKKLWEFFAG